MAQSILISTKKKIFVSIDQKFDMNGGFETSKTTVSPLNERGKVRVSRYYFTNLMR